MSLVTPLSRVLGLGTAGGAGEHWWMQRVTSVALVLLGLWLASALLALPDYSYLGLQVVIEDYVTTKALKVAAVMGSAFAHWGLGVATIFAVLKIAFGPSA